MIPIRPTLDLKKFYLFSNKVSISSDGCWNWTASTHRHGYGFFGFNKKVQLSHRVSYQIFLGEIKEGLVLDHLCRNKRCVNPDHLDPVSQKVNMQRGIHATKKYCKNGHEFSAQNTKLYIRKPNNINRICLTCVKNANDSRSLKKKRDKMKNETV